MYRLIAISLTSLLLTGCGPGTVPLEVRFVPAWGGGAIDCSGGPDGVSLSDLRFYVSEVALETAGGDSVPVTLADNGRWQGGGIALLDLEDGSGHCANGTADRNDVVVARMPPGKYAALRFTVGVPFDVNHDDPLLAAPPLDDSTMHWHWRSGYKFLRAGYDRQGGALSVHLGSAGCEGTALDVRSCRYPNRFAVRLQGWQPDAVVSVDLRELALPDAATRYGASHCESSPASDLCHALFPVFGLDPATGRQTAAQGLYRLRAR